MNEQTERPFKQMYEQIETQPQGKVCAAFLQAQKGFAPALKTATNPHFKSRYADLSAVVEAVIDSLNDNGIALLQVTHPSDTGVAIETLLIHESGEKLSGGILTVPAAKQDPQGYGSCLTYARRYSLMATCGIAPEDDDGNAASRKPASAVPSITAIRLDPIKRVNAARTLDELASIFRGLTNEERLVALEAKDAMKAKLTNAKPDVKKTLQELIDSAED
jgi:hypothetical protein